LRGQREDIARLLANVDALAIAGGHVAVLANRLRLFDVLALSGERPVIAWSAGAMACAERIVLFHDHPPFGSGHAQVLDQGLGLAEGLVFLPHARRRLDLGNAERVGMLARRMAPRAAIVLEDGAALTWRLGAGWTAGEGCLRMQDDGTLEPKGIAA
jgi:peptidase E